MPDEAGAFAVVARLLDQMSSAGGKGKLEVLGPGLGKASTCPTPSPSSPPTLLSSEGSDLKARSWELGVRRLSPAQLLVLTWQVSLAALTTQLIQELCHC